MPKDQNIRDTVDSTLDKFAGKAGLPEGWTTTTGSDLLFPIVLRSPDKIACGKFPSEEALGRFIRAVAKQTREEDAADAAL